MTIPQLSVRRLRGALHVVTALGIAFALLSARGLEAAELSGAEESAVRRGVVKAEDRDCISEGPAHPGAVERRGGP